MKLIEKFTEDLKAGIVDTNNYCGPKLIVNDNYKDIIIDDIYTVDFIALYASLLILFSDNGILSIDSIIINRIKKYFHSKKTMSKEHRLSEKIWINSLYVKELSSKTLIIFDLFTRYMTKIYTELSNNNEHNWIYIEVDRMFFRGYPNILIDNKCLSEYLQYEIRHFEFGIFKARGRYCLFDQGEITLRGYSNIKIKNSYKNASDRRGEELKSLLLEEARNRKINKILNVIS